MNSPVPTPRSTSVDTKKPVPTPRRTKVPETINKSFDDNSFSRKAKQKLEDLGEGTRQSLRKLSRRFSSASQKNSIDEPTDPLNTIEPESLNIFNSIRFASPITNPGANIYNNVHGESDNSSEESMYIPPPNHPPPPLPDVSLYDAPSSVASNSTNTSTDSSLAPNNNNINKNHDYETVFPSANKKDLAIGAEDSADDSLSGSGSWRFYDSVTKSGSDVDIDNAILRPTTSKAEDNGSITDTIRSNSLYENYIPRMQRPTKSIINQFDPLADSISDVSATDTSNPRSDLKLLEQFLQDDIYGTIVDNAFDSMTISNESDTEDFINPPTPPTRFDSLPDEEPDSIASSNAVRGSTVWFDDSKSNNSPTTTTNNNNNNNAEPKKKLFQKFLDKAPEIFKNKSQKDNRVERPEISVKRVSTKKGRLYKVQNSAVEGLFGELSVRWCVLENANFICYADSTSTNIKENFKDASILSLQLLQDSKYRNRGNNDTLSCFEVNVAGKARGGHVYGTKHYSETRSWLQVIAENLTSKFPKTLTSSYSRFGWGYIKEALNGTWCGAWLIMKDREFYYASSKHNTPKSIDLRKARCIVLQPYQETDKNPATNDKGPNIIIDLPNICLYCRMWTSRETKVWCHMIKLEAHNNGPSLHEQQLTKNNIPVIVETCLNFVYLYGSMTEGIYRKTGTTSSIAELLTQFRLNAFSVHLTNDKYTEHDVATALKRFFRDLPEPLFKADKRQYLYQVSKINNESEKIRMYKAVLEEYPEIEYKTIRKLLGHLNFITTQEAKNLMNVANLSSIWGPTLMQSEYKQEEDTAIQMDSEVIGQLMSLYHDIFPEDRTEVEKEKTILDILKKYHNTPQLIFDKKNAGDFRVWIYLLKKEGQPVNVSVGPTKTAYELAAELCTKINKSPDQLIFKEVILEGKLQRPIHHGEKILDVVFRWSDWDAQDRKDNYLVLTEISEFNKYFEGNFTGALVDNLKFADSKSRFLKTYNFSFSAAILKCYKAKSEELYSWRIEDIVWYLGVERKNSSPKWLITFHEKSVIPKRTKTASYFGNTLFFNDAETRIKWINMMLKSQYANDLKPPVQFVKIE